MKKHNSIVTGCRDISEGGIILALALGSEMKKV